jgi:hypothetical protein
MPGGPSSAGRFGLTSAYCAQPASTSGRADCVNERTHTASAFEDSEEFSYGAFGEEGEKWQRCSSLG